LNKQFYELHYLKKLQFIETFITLQIIRSSNQSVGIFDNYDGYSDYIDGILDF